MSSINGVKWGRFWIEFMLYPKYPCYEVENDFTSSGKMTEEYQALMDRPKTAADSSNFEKKTHEFFWPLIEQRQQAQEAKAKFKDIPRLAKKYPQWSRIEVEDMKTQFNSYDLNHDGLIDFPELSKALDELGDSSSHAIRRKCFDDIDVDGSDSVDFEEFLGLVDAVTSSGGGGGLEAMFRKGTEQSHVGRHLDIRQQMETGLF